MYEIENNTVNTIEYSFNINYNDVDYILDPISNTLINDKLYFYLAQSSFVQSYIITLSPGNYTSPDIKNEIQNKLKHFQNPANQLFPSWRRLTSQNQIKPIKNRFKNLLNTLNNSSKTLIKPIN